MRGTTEGKGNGNAIDKGVENSELDATGYFKIGNYVALDMALGIENITPAIYDILNAT